VSFGAYHDAKERVRQATDIVDLVGGYLDLRSQGRDFVALCPWHNDSRPSLRLNRERQSWKCWVCDIGGDVFSFVMRREGIDFRDALQWLADRAGIELPSRGGGPAPAEGPGDKRTLLRAAAWAEARFHEFLLNAPEAETARRYVASRSISDPNIRRFRIGYSPPTWQWILEQASRDGIARDVLQAVGLVAVSERTRTFYDRFRNRVIFPIRDPQGRTIAFGGRVLPGDDDANAAKYINSPETPLFSKSEQLYGLDLARDAIAKSRHIMIMEGYTDVIAAVQHGVAEVAAVLGTALGERHLRVLKRYVDRVTLVLDGDAAGRRRANDVLKLFLAANLDLRILTLPDELDPCDFLRDRGADAFRTRCDEAPDAIEHKIRVETEGLDLARDTHRANVALEEILATLALQPIDDPASPVRLRHQQIVARLGRRFGVSESALTTRCDAIRGSRATPAGSPAAERSARGLDRGPGPSASPGDSADLALSARGLPDRDRELLEILVLDPALIGQLVDTLPSELVASQEARRIYEACAERWHATESLTFAQIMTDIEDADLKNVLVDVDETARRKAARTEHSTRERLTLLVRAYDRIVARREGEGILADLQRTAEEGDDQVDKLEALLAIHRQTKCP